MKLAIFLLILCIAIQTTAPLLCAQTIPEDKLRYTGLSNSMLEKEAESVGIPPSGIKKYVVGMKNLNQEYTAGSLTWVEYIMAKRNFIEGLR